MTTVEVVVRSLIITTSRLHIHSEFFLTTVLFGFFLTTTCFLSPNMSVVIRLQTGQVEVSPQALVRHSNGRFVNKNFTPRTNKAKKRPGICKK